MSDSLYDLEVTTLDGQTHRMDEWRGQVLLVVNTASKCGFTPQYEGLQALHERFGERGLAVLGFPCNQFGAQEPGDAGEIREFCDTRFGVSFPLFAKIDVNGNDTHPLYQHLKSEAPGLLGSQNIKWNFTKFLVDRDGNILERFAPTTKPEKLESQIERALG
jgi:glutathione peroxidase